MDEGQPAHRMRRKLNIGSLTGNTNYIGKIQKVIIIGFLVSRKNQAAPLGCRPARFGDLFVEIFMRVMQCVSEMYEEPGADDRCRRKSDMQALKRLR